MRIGTWNLAGRWDARHRALIEVIDCDVLLLTEVCLIAWTCRGTTSTSV